MMVFEINRHLGLCLYSDDIILTFFFKFQSYTNKREMPEEKEINIAFTNEVTYARERVGLVKRKK